VTGAPILTYVAHSLPAESWARRAELCREHGLALEVAHRRGGASIARSLSPCRSPLQAYGLHEGHALSARSEARSAGLAHLLETIEIAGRAGILRVLAVCGFGHAPVTRAFERSLAFFREGIDCARAARVRVVIELLGTQRASAMTEPAELARLIEALDAPEVFATAVDTGHLLDGGKDPSTILAGWSPPLEELQLRGPDGSAPRDPRLVERCFASLANLPPVVCVEHHERLDEGDFGALVARVRHELDRRASAGRYPEPDPPTSRRLS
jgi:hypothetical protein